jgi:EAL and modified HD-GYP domain-containing signal transduction protein
MDTLAHPAVEADQAPKLFIARQPIVDREQRIHGYELLSRADESDNMLAAHSGNTDTALMFNALSNFGTDALFSDKIAFLNCTLDGLMGEHFEIVFPDRVVLEIPAVRGDVPAKIADIAGKLKNLRQRGFRIAAGLYADLPAYDSWLPLLSYIKVDLHAATDPVIKSLISKASMHKHLQLVAERVENRDQFANFFDRGFHLFQGFYFAKPQTVSAKIVNPAYANVLQLLDLVLKRADISELEAVLKRDPALSFKLLRYINSSGFGLMCEVTSFRHAVMILGYTKLFRWLTLLFASVRNGAIAPALARTCVTRGKMMELLAKQLMGPEDCDNAFVVGIFSTLDIMLGVTMEKALGSISLPEAVTEALLRREGQLGPLLKIVEASEQADLAQLEDIAFSQGLDANAVNGAHISALAWTETLGI